MPYTVQIPKKVRKRLAGLAHDAQKRIVKLYFNKAVDPTSLASAIKVHADGAEVSVSRSVLPGAEVVVLTPRDPWPYERQVTVQINSSIKAAKGPGLLAPFASYFVVRAQPTFVRGIVTDQDRLPLENASVTAAGLETATDAWGNFVLEFPCEAAVAPAPCKNPLGTPVAVSFRKEGYHGVTRNAHVIPKKEARAAVVTLKNFAVSAIATIAPSTDMLVEFGSAVPGFSLNVAAGSALFADGTVGGTVRATEVHPELLSADVYQNYPIAHAVSVWPEGIRLSAPAQVTFRNVGLAEGHRVIVFHYDPDANVVKPAGLGRAVGSHVVSDGGVTGLDVLGYLPISDEQAARLEAYVGGGEPQPAPAGNTLMAARAGMVSANRLASFDAGYDAYPGPAAVGLSLVSISGTIMSAPFSGMDYCSPTSDPALCKLYCELDANKGMPECADFVADDCYVTDPSTGTQVVRKSFACTGYEVYGGIPVEFLGMLGRAGDISFGTGKYAVSYPTYDFWGELASGGYLTAMIPATRSGSSYFPVGMGIPNNVSTLRNADLIVDVKNVTGLVAVVGDDGTPVPIDEFEETEFDASGHLVRLNVKDLENTEVSIFRQNQTDLALLKTTLYDWRRFSGFAFGPRSGVKIPDFLGSLEIRTPNGGETIRVYNVSADESYEAAALIATGVSDGRGITQLEIPLRRNMDNPTSDAYRDIRIVCVTCADAPELAGTVKDRTASVADFKTGVFGAAVTYRGAGIYPGDELVIVAVNRATGYVGAVTHRVPNSVVIDVKVPDVTMRPPTLRVSIERAYKALGAAQLAPMRHKVGPRGVVLSNDQYAVVSTDWQLPGWDLPRGVGGMKGRLIVMNEFNIGREVSRFDIRPGTSSERVDIPAFGGDSRPYENYVLDVDPAGPAAKFEGRNAEGKAPDYKLKRFTQVIHVAERKVTPADADAFGAEDATKRCWEMEEFNARFMRSFVTDAVGIEVGICAPEAVYSTYGFKAKALEVLHSGGGSTTYSAAGQGEVPALTTEDEGLALSYVLTGTEEREYGAAGQEKLFVMRFSNGELKGIKKDSSGNWLACDLTSDGNDVVTSTCVSMATFSLTDVSLDDLLFVELYLKGDEGNTLWKWYLNLEMEFMFLNALDGSRSNVFLPTDGSDPTKHKVLLVKANGSLGKSIDVSVAVKDQMGNLNMPPNAHDYPPASRELKMVRASDDPTNVNYDFYIMENEASVIVTNGTLASLSSAFSGVALYDDPDCVEFGPASTFESGGYANVLVKDARACIFDPQVKFDVINPDSTEIDAKSFVVRWDTPSSVGVPPVSQTQFRVRIAGLHANHNYDLEFDGNLGDVELGTPRNFGWALSRTLYVPAPVEQSVIVNFATAAPERYDPGDRFANPRSGNGCSSGTVPSSADCIRPYRFSLKIFYVSEPDERGNMRREFVTEVSLAQKVRDIIVQEYWDHYPYTGGNGAWIECIAASAIAGSAKPPRCGEGNTHEIPAVGDLVSITETSNYPDDAVPLGECKSSLANNISVNCPDHASANYSAVRLAPFYNPLEISELARSAFNAAMKTNTGSGFSVYQIAYCDVGHYFKDFKFSDGSGLNGLLVSWSANCNEDGSPKTGIDVPSIPTIDSTPVFSSGWRNPERNEAVGGVINSNHQYGKGADVSLLTLSEESFGDVQLDKIHWCVFASAARGIANRNEILIENNTERLYNFAPEDASIRDCYKALRNSSKSPSHIHVSQL